jgi:hypothetical protein
MGTATIVDGISEVMVGSCFENLQLDNSRKENTHIYNNRFMGMDLIAFSPRPIVALFIKSRFLSHEGIAS